MPLNPVMMWAMLHTAGFLLSILYNNTMHGASLQCSRDGGCTADSFHLQGPLWWGVHLPWLSGVLDSVGHSFHSKKRYMCLCICRPCYPQNGGNGAQRIDKTNSDYPAHGVDVTTFPPHPWISLYIATATRPQGYVCSSCMQLVCHDHVAICTSCH